MSKTTKPDGQASAANRPKKRSPNLDDEIRMALIGAPEMSEELGRRIGAILWPVQYEDYGETSINRPG